MQTSLQGIAKKAEEKKRYRFQNLSNLLTEENLVETWKSMNRKAASGVDRISTKMYEEDLKGNLQNLVGRLKTGRYRAKLVKRVYIPKSNGKLRPLGLPTTEDKLVQNAVTRILNAIYEADFLPGSFGYRPNRGAKDAVRDVDRTLTKGRYTCVVEADIKGFFDNIDHEWLIKMIELRVNDQRLIKLIRKWLRAGVLDTDGKVIHPLTGTPQGGVISPILANIYLHYALDLWFEKVVRKHCSGAAYLCRYADDYIAAFEHRKDAERFYRSLQQRMAKFNLSLAPEKTKILDFHPWSKESFEFLGFTFRWGKSRKGKPWLTRRTAPGKYRAALRNFSLWCKENRNLRLNHFMGLMKSKLRGYYNYYGVIGNYQSLSVFYNEIEKFIFKWLNRRSQRRSFTWPEFKALVKRFELPRPRITESREVQSPA